MKKAEMKNAVETVNLDELKELVKKFNRKEVNFLLEEYDDGYVLSEERLELLHERWQYLNRLSAAEAVKCVNSDREEMLFTMTEGEYDEYFLHRQEGVEDPLLIKEKEVKRYSK